ncbi:MAG: methionine adenosyltransferase domain-containing protein, partial [Kiritimatiellae bacterium]|nr:methionine adenosyltransferase domain-containing protein [Kiritimatiellia bacterium]
YHADTGRAGTPCPPQYYYHADTGRAGTLCPPQYRWNRLTLSIQHAPGVFAAEQHELVLPIVSRALAELEARGLAGISNLPLEKFILNGMGDFIVGGPEGDNGLSGKKLAVDFYGPEIPIGGGAICGKDLHKVDVAGAFRARELALRLLKERGGNVVTVRLGWTPGDAAPAFREAESVDSLGLVHPIPASALPPEDWFSIDAIVVDLRLTAIGRREKVLSGYFVESDFT